MKKFLLTLVSVLLMCFSAHSQVRIGDGTNTSQTTPFYPSNQYSYTQTIYLQTEIKATGTITHIQWKYSGSSPLTNSQNLDIYMGMTDKSAFASKNDWVVPASLTKVFSGVITTGSTPGWKTIDLDIDFAYTDNTKNLVIAVDENTPLSDGPTDRFYNTSVSAVRSLASISNSINFDPVNTVPFPQAFAATSYIPNVFLLGITQGCPEPFNLSVSNVGSTSATVAWDEPLVHPTGQSEYYVSLSGAPPAAGTQPTGFIPKDQYSVNLTGLISGETYYFWSRHNCEGGGYSNWSDITSFVTLCASSGSFSENFDTATTPNLPTCWTSIVKGDDVCASARVYTANLAFSPSSPNVLAMDNCNSEGAYDIIAVSPVVSTLNQGAYRLRFRVYAALPGSTVEVGTLNSNDSSTAVFNKIGTAENLTSTFTEYTIPFTAYTGTDTYIGIRASETNPQQNAIYIDNVVWEFIPTCPNVTNVKVVSATDSTAEIGWTESGTEGNWDIVIGPAITDDPTTLDPSRIKRTDVSGIYLYEGLTGTTAYKAWVRSVCDGPNGEGAWIGPVSFTTTCAPLTEFSENFNNLAFPALPQCWAKIIRPNSGTIGNGSKIETVSGQNGPVKDGGFVTIYSYLSTGNFDFILVTPPVPNLYADTANKHRLRFWARYAADVEIGTLDSNTDSATFTVYKTVTMVNGINEYIVNFDTPPSVGAQKFIGFRFPNPPVVGGYVISFDDIVWEKIPECPEVTAVAVPETTTATAKVTWTHNGEGGAWEVALGDMAATNPDILPKLVSDENPFLVVGEGDPLSPGISYKVWVRSNCGVKGYSVWTGPVVFTTECLPVDFFREGFDSFITLPGTTPPNNSTELLPPCWSKIIRGGAGDLNQFSYIRTMNTNTNDKVNFTLPNYVQMNRQDSTERADIILVSPPIATLGQPYRLVFDSTGGGVLEVGVVDGNTSNSNWIPYGEQFVVNFSGAHTIVDFTAYDGVFPANAHIGIKAIGGNVSSGAIINIDNVSWEPVPNCVEMTKKTEVPFTSPTTATFTWEKVGPESGWDISVHPSSPTGSGAITGFVNAASAPTITLSGLTPGTTYYVWIRTVCDPGQYGAWNVPTKFVTPCESVNIIYSENFETPAIGSIPVCTDATSEGGGGFWQVNNANSYGFATKNLRSGPSPLPTNAWFFTRGVNLEAGTKYKMSYLRGTSAPAGIGPCQAPCGPVDFKVTVGNAPVPFAMNTILKDYPGLKGPAESDFVNFMAPTSGVYYFGFHNYSVAEQSALAIDDIVVDIDLGSETFDSSKFSYYPNPVRERLNVTYNEPIDSVSVFDMLGQRVLDQSIKATNGVIDMSALARGAYLLKVSFDNHIETVKIIKE